MIAPRRGSRWPVGPGPRAARAARAAAAAPGQTAGRRRRRPRRLPRDPWPLAAAGAAPAVTGTDAGFLPGSALPGSASCRHRRRIHGIRQRDGAGRGRLAGRAGELVDQRHPPELEQQHPEVARVEQLDPDVRVELAQPAELAVLLAHQLLLERGQLDVQLDVREVEVGREALDDVPVQVPADRERVGLVGPADVVEVEDARELGLARMRERADPVVTPAPGVRRRARRAGHGGRPASRRGAAGPRPRPRARWATAPASGPTADRAGVGGRVQGGRVGVGVVAQDHAHRPAPARRAVELDEGDVAAISEDGDPVDRHGRPARRAAGPGESCPESAMVHRPSVYRRRRSASGAVPDTPMGYYRRHG